MSGRQCPRCGIWVPRRFRRCPQDGASLVMEKFEMNNDRIRYLHGLALGRKGLSYEDYKLRLHGVTGHTTCKDLSRVEFLKFVSDLKGLPDAIRR